MNRILAAGLVLILGAGAAWADQVKVLLEEGKSQHSRGRLGEAAFDYRMALKSDIFAAEPHFDLGVALYQLGKTTEAAQEFRQAIKSGYTDAAAPMMLALATSDKTESLDAYGKAVQKEPAYGAPGFDPDEVLLTRSLLPKKEPRSPKNSQRWAAFSAPVPTAAAANEDASPVYHARLASALYEKSQQPSLGKAEAAEMRKQAAAEYMKAATLTLAP